MVDCFSFSLLLGSNHTLLLIRFRHLCQFPFSSKETVVLHRFQPLHQMATSNAHDLTLQEANTLSFVHPILMVSPSVFRNLGQYELPFNQTMVTVRVQPLHTMASYIPHDSFLQEAISFLPLFSILKKKKKKHVQILGVMSLGRHTRPACNQALLAMC